MYKINDIKEENAMFDSLVLKLKQKEILPEYFNAKHIDVF